VTSVSPAIKELDFEWASVVPLSHDARLHVPLGQRGISELQRAQRAGKRHYRLQLNTFCTQNRRRAIPAHAGNCETVGVKQSKNFREQKLTIGLDLGDQSSWYCVLDGAGEVLLEQKK
jgi:hypothetical protein